MNSLNGKNIILGISGSIAAYKAAFLTRLLIKAGADVRVIMTDSACDFISPLTLATLSRNTVISSISNADTWNNHVELGLWADAYVIAPLTANTLAKMANGQADNMLLATYLSARCPVFVAPAMDLDMWEHGSTKRNLELITSYGDQIIPVGHGELASGLVGDGRMAEPENIISFLSASFDKNKPLKGKRVMITAGPTQEPIDPVRYIGNRSTGKMGIALAETAVQMGAEVDLILGPTSIEVPKGINVIPVTTAASMYDAAIGCFDKCDVAIMAAAVADYTPSNPASEKIKKTGKTLDLDLVKTQDIAASLGKKKNKQLLIGFALETQDVFVNAKAKLQKKNFDFIVVNSLKDTGAGFGYDTNKVSILFPDGDKKEYPLKSKKDVSKDILQCLLEYWKTHE